MAQRVDVHLQNTQSLLAKGLSAVVTAKQTLMSGASKPMDAAKACQEVKARLTTSVALLSNAFLEL